MKFDGIRNKTTAFLISNSKNKKNVHTYIYIYIYIYIFEYIYVCICKVKMVTIVEGDLKAPFSIATTPRCRGGHYSFPWIAPLYSWYVPYNAEC